MKSLLILIISLTTLSASNTTTDALIERLKIENKIQKRIDAKQKAIDSKRAALHKRLSKNRS